MERESRSTAMITVIIPACNEEKRVYEVVQGAGLYAAEVIVIDDGSADATARVAGEAGARTIRHGNKQGYIEAIKTGLRQAKGDIIITMDADGEHDPKDIPLMIEPIHDDKADLVLGARGEVPRVSEKIINWLTSRKVKVTDSCTGFRAMRKDLALKLNLRGRCTCGVLVLEANYYGARVTEIPINIVHVDKPRKIAWYHIKQVFYVLAWLLKNKESEELR